MSRCGVKPRPHWITTEFGGKVSFVLCAPCGSQGSYERRSGVAERAEEARGGHYRKVDQLESIKTMSWMGLVHALKAYFLLHQPISNPNVVYLKPPYMGSAQSLKNTKHTYIGTNMHSYIRTFILYTCIIAYIHHCLFAFLIFCFILLLTYLL
ncbi:unnamed protein product, partial [Brassica oleracea var. botrytis]